LPLSGALNWKFSRRLDLTGRSWRNRFTRTSVGTPSKRAAVIRKGHKSTSCAVRNSQPAWPSTWLGARRRSPRRTRNESPWLPVISPGVNCTMHMAGVGAR
jgi:hypothetical protein